MIFESMYELTQFFGASKATFYNAARSGHFVVEDNKMVDMENPSNWNYFYKHAKKRGLDLHDFFGKKFDESKIVAPTRNRTIAKTNRKTTFDTEENTAKPGKEKTTKEKTSDWQVRKIIAEAQLKEEMLEGQRIKNKKSMGGLIDKELVDNAFKKMLATLEATIKGSIGKGPGEKINNLSISLKNGSTRERIIGFMNLYADMIQELYNEFVQLYAKQLEELEKAGSDAD